MSDPHEEFAPEELEDLEPPPVPPETIEQVDALLKRAEGHWDRGEHDDLERTLREACTLWPDNPWLVSQLSEALCEPRRYEEAVEVARHATTLAPDYPPAHFALTRALHLAERFAESLVPAYRLLALDPEYSTHYVTVAAPLYELGRARECLEFASEGLSRNPGDTDCMRFAGLALALLGRSDEARQVAEAVLVNRSDRYTVISAAWIYHWVGDDAVAVGLFRSGLAMQPESEWGHTGLGMTLLKMGDVAGGREHLEEAIRLYPGTLRARRALDELARAGGPPGTP